MRIKKVEQQVYDYLKKKIELGELGPNSKVVEEDIAHQLNISRSPVRGAIKRLEVEGYLTSVPYKGAVVQKKGLDGKTYVEQLKVFELLLMQHLFQSEGKRTIFPFEELNTLIKDIEDLFKRPNRELIIQKEKTLLIALLSEQSNDYFKGLLVTIIGDVLSTHLSHLSFAEEGIVVFVTHFKEVIGYLEDQDYPKARREVRIFVNNLTLSAIDMEDLEHNKYQM